MKIKIDRSKIKEVYYKRSRPNKPLASYTQTLERYKNKPGGKIVKAIIRKDPILKNYPQYEKAVIQHELSEMKLRSKGYSKREAHGLASELEPKLTRGKTVKQNWKELRTRAEHHR